MWHSILLAGGSARRMGLETNKVLLPIGGVPAIRRSAKVDDMTFRQTPLIYCSPKSGACQDYRRLVRYLEWGVLCG